MNPEQAVEDLLRPIGADQFLADDYEKRPLLERDEPWSARDLPDTHEQPDRREFVQYLYEQGMLIR